MENRMVFHHIGIATENMREMTKFLKEQFKIIKITPPVYDEKQRAEVSMISLEEGIRIELIAGEQVKTMVQKGRYLYHTCYMVKDIDAKVDELIEQDYKLLKEVVPAILFQGKRIAFMSGRMGIIELLEEESLTDKLINRIGLENPMQKKYLGELLAEYLLPMEKRELEDILNFFMKDCSLEMLADAYLLFVEDTFKETKYFIDHGHYRYSSFREVDEKVYFNDVYMRQYMKGLQISGYIWKNHLKIHRWFQEKLMDFSGKDYLEIGPGHGQYFTDAINLGRFENYIAIDLSQSSIDLTRKYVESFKKCEDSHYELICDDFINYKFSNKFDGICISEVLEHVEEPGKFMEKIHEITNPGAKVYISVPINAPAVDHIYLYEAVEDVLEMVEAAGFRVNDTLYVTENDISYEKAVKRKRAINCAMCVIRQEGE